MFKRFTSWLTEDGGAGGGAGGVGGIANAAGTGAVAGLGVGPKGEPGVDNRKKKKKRVAEATDTEIEKAAEAVHAQWMDKQEELGHDSHKSPDGKEEYMVPYDELSEPAKELDRGAAKAVLDALKIDEALDPRAVKAADAYEDAMDKELGDDYGNFMELLMVKREMADDGDPKAIKAVEEMTARLKRAKAAGEAARKKVLGEDYKPSDEKFAGATVFEVDMDRVMNVKGPKHPRHRYSKYVGTDEIGETIRQHGRKRGSGDIVLKDQKTAVMTYLRRKPVK